MRGSQNLTNLGSHVPRIKEDTPETDQHTPVHWQQPINQGTMRKFFNGRRVEKSEYNQTKT